MPNVSWASTLNGKSAPAVCVVMVAGLMTKVVTGPWAISTRAVPFTLPWVAVTCLPAVVVTWAVKVAVALGPGVIVPPSVLQVGVTGTGLPYWSVPVAVKVCVVPTVTVAGSGVTVRVVSGPATRVTLAVSFTLPWVTVTRPEAGAVWAVNRAVAVRPCVWLTMVPMSVLQVGTSDT